MLIVNPAPRGEAVTRVVDRVEIGSRAAPLRTTDIDTELSSEMPQPSALNRLFRDVASRVTQSVVFIQVRTRPPEEGEVEYEGQMRDYFFRNPTPRQSVGSGVIISNQGYIVTNQHVVERAEEIQVTLNDKRQFDARVVGADPSTDLAVIKVESDAAFPAVSLGNSDAIEVGDWVVAVGNPFRLTSTVTAGIVSALGRQVDIIDSSFRIENFIQTDAAINPGNSGGALVNLQGELVGINTAIATESGSYEGYGFAVPSNLMERIVKDLIAYGEVRRGYMGVSIEEINDRRAREIGLDSIRGVYVAAVRRDGGAYRAGVRDGDVVLSIEGTPVNAPNELQSTVVRRRPGDVIDVRVWRDGAVRSYGVELLGRDAPAYRDWVEELTAPPAGEAPDDGRTFRERREPPSSPGEPLKDVESWGMGVRDLEADEASAFGVSSGAYVAYVERGTPAGRAGLPRDVVVTRADDTSVTGADDVVDVATSADAPVLLRVERRDGTSAFYEIP